MLFPFSAAIVHHIVQRSPMKRKQPCADEGASIGASIDLHVLCMTGEGLTLTVQGATLGREVQRMVAEPLRCFSVYFHMFFSLVNLSRTWGCGEAVSFFGGGP
jgi:hypothetical protein